MTTTRRHFATIAAAAILTLSALAGIQPASAGDASELEYVGGTIRWQNSTTWATVTDAGHVSEGIASVELLTDRVRVHFSECHAKVSSFQATPDEQFTSASVRVGASVGLCYADVFFYMTGTTPVSPALLSKAYANVWITGFFVPSAG